MILGAVCGDVIGSLYEGKALRTKDYNFEMFSPFMHYTDDTVLTVAVAQWLLEDRMLSHENLIDCYVSFVRTYPHAKFSSTFKKWIISEDHKPYYAKSNGSAMRVSAVGYVFETIEDTLKAAKITAEVSHNHPEGIAGAQATAAAVFMARKGYSKEQIRQFIEKKFDYNLHRKYDDIKTTYTCHVSCAKTVPESIICFLESVSYKDCIRMAISMGGDADTMAAIAGAIAAAYYGEIPDEICDFVLGKLPIEMLEIIEQFNNIFDKKM